MTAPQDEAVPRARPRPISKARAALESAARTFLQAAVPAFVGAVTASRPDGVTAGDFLLAAGMAAAAAGIAALLRVVAPIQTDRQGVYVEGVGATGAGGSGGAGPAVMADPRPPTRYRAPRTLRDEDH